MRPTEIAATTAPFKRASTFPQSMLIRIGKHVRLPLPEVFAWCTDFRETDPELSRVRLRTRRLVRRDATQVAMEETGVMGFPFAAQFSVQLSPPERWIADGQSNMGRTHNEYRLAPDSDGTRIDIAFDLHLTGLYRLMSPFARGLIARRLSNEWDDYVRAMESGPWGNLKRRDLTRALRKAPGRGLGPARLGQPGAFEIARTPAGPGGLVAQGARVLP